jgi:hypothetical protein
MNSAPDGRASRSLGVWGIWSSLLTSEEKDSLVSMIGAVLNHYGAQSALEDGMEVLVDMYVHRESGALTIASSLQELEFEGMADECAGTC